MKRFMKIMALSMALALTFGMTTFAAGSVSTKDPSITNETLQAAADAANKNAVAQEVKIGDTTATVTPKYEPVSVAYTDDVIDAMESDADFKNDYKESKLVAAPLDLSLYDASGAKLTVTSEVTLRFSVSGVKAGGSYVVLHYIDSEGAWEVIDPSKVEDGYLTATFSGLSPVAVVEYAKAGDSNDDDDDDSDDTTTTPVEETNVSPKTGETLPVAVIMAAICLAGAAVAVKKVKFND